MLVLVTLALAVIALMIVGTVWQWLLARWMIARLERNPKAKDVGAEIRRKLPFLVPLVHFNHRFLKLPIPPGFDE